MENIVFDDGNFVIFTRHDAFFIRYDAGAHQVELREDEISKGDVDFAINNTNSITKLLFKIQKELQDSGKDPYKSNL